MNRLILVAMVSIALAGGSAQAALIGEFVPHLVNAAATDGGTTFNIDTYRFELKNTSAEPLLAVEMALSGEFYNIAGQNSLFRTTPALPTFFGQNIPDSFFVGNGTQLVGTSSDLTTALSAAWTYPASAPIVEGNATTTLAYLAVPTGTPVEFTSGRGTYDLASFVDITVGTQASPALGGMILGSGDLSADLQAAFGQGDGSSILLADGIMLSNDDPNGSLLDLGDITGTVSFSSYVGQVSGAVTQSAVDPTKFSVLLQGPFTTFDPSVPLEGTVQFTSEFGDPSTLSFNFAVSVPEPSTVGLISILLLGVGVVFRRRVS